MLSTLSRMCSRPLFVAISQQSANLTAKASISTSTLRASAVKTPIQEWGWQYLVRQKALKRPISPHLTVYKPMMTWSVSGAHRIAGCAMGVAGVFIVTVFLTCPFDFTDTVRYIKSWNIPRPILALAKWAVAFLISFHTLNGIRFIGFDMGKFLGSQKAMGGGIKSIYMGAYLVIGLAALIATYTAFLMPTTLPIGEPVPQKKQ